METPELTKNQVMKSVAWVGGMKYAAQGVTWLITIIVIRLLNPSDYGLMAQAYVCIGFLTMLSEMGFGAAIVQIPQIKKATMQTIGGMVFLSNGMIFLLLYIGAPAVAGFFQELRLTSILRVLSTCFLLLSLYVIPQALLLKQMNFRAKGMVEFCGALLSSILTLGLALAGFGVWSLVAGTLAVHLIQATGYNLVARCFFWPKFRFQGMGKIFSFGGFLTGGRILWYFYSQADIVIAGRFLNSQLMGFYSVALQLCNIPIEKFIPIVNQVAFPAYSRIQNDPERLKIYFLKSVRLISVIIFPCFAGLIIIAPEMVSVILGEKWKAVTLPLQLISCVMPLRALSSLTPPALNGIGRSDVSFVNVAIASIIMPFAFVMGVSWGLTGLCMAWISGYCLVFAIMTARSLKVLGVSLRSYGAAMAGPLLPCAGMMLSGFGIRSLATSYFNEMVMLLIVISLCVLIYFFLLLLIRRDLIREIKALRP